MRPLDDFTICGCCAADGHGRTCSGSQNCLLHSAETHPGLNETQGRFRSRTSHWDVGGSGITAGTDRSSLSSFHMTCHRPNYSNSTFTKVSNFLFICLAKSLFSPTRFLLEIIFLSLWQRSARAGRVEEEDAWGQGHRELQ